MNQMSDDQFRQAYVTMVSYSTSRQYRLIECIDHLERCMNLLTEEEMRQKKYLEDAAKASKPKRQARTFGRNARREPLC